jgi:23S rRNA-/tRNA-specific pseudouridylate synthase
VLDDPPCSGDFVVRDGLRYCKPYFFDYFAHVKNRWAGLTLLELFCKEFDGRTREYYTAAIAAGRLRVEETSMSLGSAKRKGGAGAARPAASAGGPAQLAPPEAPLRDGQRIRHLVHRHEPPVLDLPVTVLAQTATALVVNKPASLPVHPTGQYRRNTILGLLACEARMSSSA